MRTLGTQMQVQGSTLRHNSKRGETMKKATAKALVGLAVLAALAIAACAPSEQDLESSFFFFGTS